MQLDEVTAGLEPGFACFIQPVSGSIVHHEKDLPAPVGCDELLEEPKERGAVEHGSETVVEFSGVEIHGTEYVRGFPLAICVHARLLSYPRPRLMQCAVKPEARLVFEQHYTTACARFFFIAGSLFLSQISCFSASARASLLRGRCTEKPSECNILGIW